MKDNNKNPEQMLSQKVQNYSEKQEKKEKELVQKSVNYLISQLRNEMGDSIQDLQKESNTTFKQIAEDLKAWERIFTQTGKSKGVIPVISDKLKSLNKNIPELEKKYEVSLQQIMKRQLIATILTTVITLGIGFLAGYLVNQNQQQENVKQEQIMQ